MKIYTLTAKQNIPVSLDSAWDFISNPKNLAVITPPEMGFKTLSGDERKMHPGQIIHYTITPLFGIKIQWITEITHVAEKSFFVDEQRYGPYSFWHHKHFLKAVPGGVEMEDIVHYKLPLGILGQLAQPLVVKSKLEKIFEFRRNKIIEIFGEFNTDPK